MKKRVYQKIASSIINNGGTWSDLRAKKIFSGLSDGQLNLIYMSAKKNIRLAKAQNKKPKLKGKYKNINFLLGEDLEQRLTKYLEYLKRKDDANLVSRKSTIMRLSLKEFLNKHFPES